MAICQRGVWRSLPDDRGSRTKLFDTIAPRFGDRKGGYLRIVRTAWQKGDGAEKAFIELLGSEKVLDEKREKRAEARAKRVAEAKKAMEEAEAQAQPEAAAEASEKKKKKSRLSTWTNSFDFDAPESGCVFLLSLAFQF